MSENPVRDAIQHADRFQDRRLGHSDISGCDCDLCLLHKCPRFGTQRFVLFAAPLGGTDPLFR